MAKKTPEQIAEEQIEEARRTGAIVLGLGGLGLNALPDSIGQLASLRTLDLAANELTSLPESIGQLTSLRGLRVSSNGLASLPESIGQLGSLQTLHLDDNGLTSLPESIGQLGSLRDLNLEGNPLGLVPESIGQLASLQTLDLFLNGLTSLPESIGRLASLQTLELDRNILTSLPASIGQLGSLRDLSLDGNQLRSLPASIGQLASLEILSLRENKLTALPESIGQLAKLQDLSLDQNQLTALPESLRRLRSLKRLYLHDNPRLGIPPEVLGPAPDEVDRGNPPARPADILDYYFRVRRGPTRSLNEVKVILVGQGSVGKTSLVKRIVYGTFNPGEEKTEGIYINKDWGVPGKNGGRVQVNFWDFGGQEIMHATHQFFLTKRTVYVLVLDARKGENESNIHYWLKIIRSYGGDSPVLVVTNKCETHHLDLNETRLTKDYPNIRGFFKTSCETGTGIEQLKAAIQDQIHGMPHVFDLLPAAYFSIKGKLEQLARQENYIDIRRYHALCNGDGVDGRDQQDVLLRFLHDLGSVLSFSDPDSPYSLREMSVLNPEWVTEGVYKILNHKELARRGGVLTGTDLPGILKSETHPHGCHPYIIDMMHKFELSFTIKEREKWLVAELLPVNEPTLDWEVADALNFQYQYQVLPPGIICRFIVRRYANLTKEPVYWRSGVVLDFDGCGALVRSDTDKGRMYISVRGPENGRRSALAIIRDEFARIHATVPNLLPKQMVPLPDDPDVVVEYEHLLTLEREGVSEFIPQGAAKKYAVAQMLAGIAPPWGDGPYLYPPFFGVEPQTSFADAWEVFCCDVLNRHEKTTDIRRRHAPEGGVDLLWRERQIAYQCKSVESGRTGDFDVGKAVESLEAAKARQSETGWKQYVVCTNVALTGPQERKLREAAGDVGLKLLTPSFWVPRCHEQWRHVQGRFRYRAERPRHDRRDV